MGCRFRIAPIGRRAMREQTRGFQIL